MDGEFVFGAFCLLWLVVGGIMLLLRVADGMRHVSLIRELQRNEKELVETIDEQNAAREGLIDDLETTAAQRSSELAEVNRQLAQLEAKPSPIITVVGREPPRPSEALWVARFDDPARPAAGPRYIGAWGEDPAMSRAKIVAAMGAADVSGLENLRELAEVRSKLFE
jgi:hypothetical protein